MNTDFKLSISKEITQSIEKFITRPKPENDEYEVKFSFTTNNVSKNSLDSDPKIARKKWYQLLLYLSTSQDFKRLSQASTEKSRVDIYGDYRKITDISIPSKYIVQEKKRYFHTVLFDYRIGPTVYTVKFHASREENKNVIPSGKPDISKIRTRISFLSPSKKYRYDLTYIEPDIYDVEIEYLAPTTLEDFFQSIKIIIIFIKGDTPLITNIETTFVIQQYNMFFKDEAKFDTQYMYKKVLSQPINLKRHFIPNLSAYSVTNKLNGIRMIVCFFAKGIYGIKMTSEVVKLSSSLPPQLIGTVCDTEFFDPSLASFKDHKEISNNLSKGIYAFDVMFVASKDVRSLNLDKRYMYLENIEKIMNSHPDIIFRVKKFEFSPDLYQSVNNVFNMIDLYPDEYHDGLIFTPITEPFTNKSTYKWKPPETLTIDFLAQSIGNNRYILQVSVAKGNILKVEKFTPELKPNVKFDGIIYSKIPLSGIGEYAWNGLTFVLVRDRPDKSEPNHISIARDVWEDIMYPISKKELLELISGGEKRIDMLETTVEGPEKIELKETQDKNIDEDRDSLRKFHNSKKRNLIEKYCKKKTIIDLGAGKGGDLYKYIKAEMEYLLAIDPNKTHIDEFERRLQSLPANLIEYQQRTKLIHTSAENTSEILRQMKNHKGLSDISSGVDIAAMFFSLSFFFETEASLNALIKTLNDTTKQESIFIGTTIDGKAVYELLRDKDEVKLYNITIKKKYIDDTQKVALNASNIPSTSDQNKSIYLKGVGNAVEFQYENSATVSEKQTEWLVDWNLFVEKLSSIGFQLEESKYFVPPEYLTDDQKTISRLYRHFIFTRKTKQNTIIEKSKHSKIQILKMKDNTTLKNLITPQKLVRTGSEDENSLISFYSCILTVISKEFKTSDEKARRKMIEDFVSTLRVSREDFSGDTPKEREMTIGSDTPSGSLSVASNVAKKRIYIEIINYCSTDDNIITTLKYFSSKRDNLKRYITLMDKEIHKINPIITYNQWKNELIRRFDYAFMKQEDNKLRAQKEILQLLKESQEKAYQTFLRNISKLSTTVFEIVNVVQSKIQKNIIFTPFDLSSGKYTTKGFVQYNCSFITSNYGEYILIIRYGERSESKDDHYEVIGEITESVQGKGSLINREFNKDNKLIQKILNDMC